MNRRTFLRLGALGASSLLLGRPGASKLWAQGKTLDMLRVGVTEDAPTMDPHMHSHRAGLNMQIQIMEQLVRRDEKAQLVGELAERWEPVSDRTWRFYLRRGVKFHNGNPLNAEAVRFSLNRIIDPQQNSPVAGNLRAVSAVHVVDDYTVDIDTHHPAPTLPASLASYALITDPQHVAEVGDRGLASHPIGTGPYRFVEWKRDEYLLLERFDDYWAGPSSVRRLMLRPIPDANARLLALRAGEIDIMQDVPPEMALEVTRDPNLRISAVPSVRLHYIQFRTDQPPFNDVRVRQALNYAVDKQRIIDALLNGYGKVISQPVTPEFFGYNPNLEPYPYDPDRARQLLREAGVRDGLVVEMASYPAVRPVAEVIAAFLADVGIQLTHRVSEFAVNYENLTTGRASPMHYSTWGAYSLFDAEGTLPHVFREGAIWSYYNDPRIDELTDIGATTLDPEVRLAAYHEAMRILHEEAPWLYLWQQFELHGANRKTDWEGLPDNLLRFYGMQVL